MARLAAAGKIGVRANGGHVMAINLVSMVSEFLTPDMRDTIARSLGISSSVTGKAIGAAIPGLLGSLAGAASTNDGANKLFDAVNKGSADVANALSSPMSASGRESTIAKGEDMLSSLLGGSSLVNLAGSLGKYAGIGPGMASSLLGLLAPVVTGVLGKAIGNLGLNASGLGDLLASQKVNIANALPSGFGEALKSAGVPGFAGMATSETPRSVPPRGQYEPSVAHAAYSAPPTRQGAPAWALWAIPILALAALAWWMLGTHGTDTSREVAINTPANTTVMPKTVEPATEPMAPSTEPQTPASNMSGPVTVEPRPPVQAAIGAVDVSSELQTAIGSVKTALEGITDPATAQDAVTKIKDATTKLDQLGGEIGKLAPADKGPLASIVAAAKPAVDDLANKVLAMPGVEPVARPAIDAFKAKMDELAKT
jgi:hypothetical protein